MQRRVIERPSPNHDARPAGRAIDILVLHYPGMPSAAAALDRLTDPAAKVSAHYAIDEDGAIWRLVPEARSAWHAGAACWAGERDINGPSIGNELGHSEVARGRKPAPGGLFDWRRLAAAGIGLWPEPAADASADAAEVKRWL